MIDFVAYLAAQEQTGIVAREALPDAPVVPTPEPVSRRAPYVRLRQRVSLTLRRLADLVEPLPESGRPAMADCR
jgi:hypothetical protein